MKKVTFDEETGHIVVLNILNTLAKCFLHDINSSFSSKDRVNKLLDPIVDQISNNFGTNQQYMERISDGVILCVKFMAKSISDYNLIKDMNYKILMKTRDNSAQIRCQALNVIHHLMLSMSEEYLSLLPESVSFLVELHEDDSEEIQKLLAIVIADIERIFGEPISNYF